MLQENTKNAELKKLYIHYVLSVLFNICFLPLWFINIDVSTIEFLYVIIVMPVYLNITSYRMLNAIDKKSFFKKLIVMFILIFIGCVIGYFNWGISTNNLFTPDSKTISFIETEIRISWTITAVIWIIIYWFGYEKKAEHSK